MKFRFCSGVEIRLQAGLLAWLACFAPLALGVDHPNVSSTTFCYDEASCGPSTWPGLCATGKSQSPINIDTLRVAPNDDYFPFLLNPQYSREDRHCFFAQNNGHSAQFEFTPNTSALNSDLTVCGGNMLDCYNFAQFHFHWAEKDADGSEHTINGVRYPLEMHVVHYKSIYNSLADALSHNDSTALAVIAVLFEVRNYNRFLEPIIASLESLQTPGNVTQFYFVLRISDLLPHGGKDFARYHGSLTTPTCDEKVLWTVFLDPLSISEDQMNRFRVLRNAEGVSDFNFRPIQALNGRIVTLYRNIA